MRGHERRRRNWFAGEAVVYWLASLCACLGAGPELRPEQVFETISPAVVTLEVETKSKEKCVGTGFLALREGIVVTAWHLVQDAKKVKARFCDGTVKPISGLVDYDEAKDIALVHLESTHGPMAGLDTNAPAVGSRAYAIGAPRGFEFSLTEGLISQVRIVDGFRNYQVSCPISPGNSGGPVLNARGEVLGVVVWSEKEAQNLNFATPIGYALALDSSRPETLWEAASRHQPRPGSRQHNRATADRWRAPPPADNLEAFERLMRGAAGKKVTIVVFGDNSEKTFQFTIPNSPASNSALPTVRQGL